MSFKNLEEFDLKCGSDIEAFCEFITKWAKIEQEYAAGLSKICQANKERFEKSKSLHNIASILEEKAESRTAFVDSLRAKVVGPMKSLNRASRFPWSDLKHPMAIWKKAASTYTELKEELKHLEASIEGDPKCMQQSNGKVYTQLSQVLSRRNRLDPLQEKVRKQKALLEDQQHELFNKFIEEFAQHYEEKLKGLKQSLLEIVALSEEHFSWENGCIDELKNRVMKMETEEEGEKCILRILEKTPDISLVSAIIEQDLSFKEKQALELLLNIFEINPTFIDADMMERVRAKINKTDTKSNPAAWQMPTGTIRSGTGFRMQGEMELHSSDNQSRGCCTWDSDSDAPLAIKDLIEIVGK